MSEPPAGPATRPETPAWVKVFAVGAALVVVAVVLLLTGVLGQGHGPGRHAGGLGQGATAAGVGEPAAEAEAARTIEIIALDAMSFQPATATVTAGEVVRFEVTNSGELVHEFTIGDAAMQRQHAQAMAHTQGRMPHGFPNSVTVQPGETMRLTWRFGDAGTLEYACHIPGHYEAGMRGRMTVA